jgi:hypothetical protein
MSARRSIAQRTGQLPNPNVKQPVMNNQPRDGQSETDGIQKMHPMAVLTMHEDRIVQLEEQVKQLQSNSSSTSSSPVSTTQKRGDESSMLAECIKQIKYLTQENQTNRNLARELTLELLRLKSSLQEDGQIKMHISEEQQEQYEMFKNKANTTEPPNKSIEEKQSQNVRDELMSTTSNTTSTMSFNGNTYDPNTL